MQEMDSEPPPLSYRDAGVDIDAGNRLVDLIKPLAARTRRPGVLAGVGGFAALFEAPAGRYRRPVLVSSTDGVGTKLKLALAGGRHDSIGIDLVAMCVNDVAVTGAEPLFFLDYYATGRLDVAVARQVIEGIARGCEMAGAALVGGETAEMPGLYQPGEYDVAGFCVGVVEQDRIIDGRSVQPGDAVLGIASSGPHSNGYSLIRKILDRAAVGLEETFHGGRLADVLLEPTRIYVRTLLALAREVPVKALAHITGGGLIENLPRVLPAGCMAVIQRSRWPRVPIFDWLQAQGQVPEQEMYRTFNCGVGIAACVPHAHLAHALEALDGLGETAWPIGEVRAADGPAGVVIEP
jgi:phosphoribosylformylglycinamidine cyclo-ligase